MGYRSEVAIAFYTHDTEHNGVVSLWLKSNFPYEDWELFEDHIVEKEDPTYSFLLHVFDVKWYDNYPAVVRMNKLVKEFAELFCGGSNDIAACEFMRNGEGDSDVEYSSYGQSQGALSILKSIYVEL